MPQLWPRDNDDTMRRNTLLVDHSQRGSHQSGPQGAFSTSPTLSGASSTAPTSSTTIQGYMERLSSSERQATRFEEQQQRGIVARFSPSFKAEKKLGDLKSTFFRCPASGTMTARSPVTCLPQHTPHTSPAASPKNSNSALPPRHPTSGSTAINDACEIHHDDGADYANQVHRANEVRDTRQRLRQELWQRQDPRRLRQRMNCEQSGSQQSELMPKGDSSFW